MFKSRTKLQETLKQIQGQFTILQTSFDDKLRPRQDSKTFKKT